MALKLACVMLLICMVMGAASMAQAAITCGEVTRSLTPCVGYLKSGGAVPPSCCSGIRSLNAGATTTPDRRTACNCLKSAAGSISGINYGRAAGLPGKCGVNIPYKISPSTDCSKVT